jgi:septal ring factor EnvC (AmiA/AmiB activator)
MMAQSARTIRSNAAPARREDESYAPSARPQLTVVAGRKAQGNVTGLVNRVGKWIAGGTMPMVYVVVAVVFLFSALLGSLALRTQMVENSYESTQVQANISRLSQDVEDDQATLDQLQASLPSKAQEMGMVPQQGTVSVDLNGYQPTEKDQ